jgi:hypothetical protein
MKWKLLTLQLSVTRNPFEKYGDSRDVHLLLLPRNLGCTSPACSRASLPWARRRPRF